MNVRTAVALSCLCAVMSTAEPEQPTTLPKEEFLRTSKFTPAQFENYMRFWRELGQLSQFHLKGDVETSFSRDPPALVPLFEEDIVLQPWQMSEILEAARETAGFRDTSANNTDASRAKRTITSNLNARWPSAIPYMYDGGPREQIEPAIAYWQRETCVQFRETPNPRGNYINFIRGNGCYSSVGMTGYGGQDVSIGYGCEKLGIAAHEIGHALGFWHEQARPDRDGYVDIIDSNIQVGTEGNFLKRGFGDVDLMGMPYDMGSVMHYGPTAFSKQSNSYTIQSLDPNMQNTMGQRIELSFYNVKYINRAYCNNICATQLACKNNGYTDPKNCQTCRCPFGLGGKLCDQAKTTTTSCGVIDLQASTTVQKIVKQGQGLCNWYIKSAPGSKIRLDLDSFQFDCYGVTCEDSFLEIKYKQDLANTGARICCQRPTSIESESNEVVVIYKGKFASAATLRFVQVGNGILTTTTPQPTTTARTTRPPAVRTTLSPAGRTTTTPSSGTWTSWSSWSACSNSCGGCGLQFRARQCSTSSCIGSSFESQRCAFNACPRSSNCTEKYLTWCGDKYCAKERPIPCGGAQVQCCDPYVVVDNVCTDKAVQGVWSNWSEFTACPVTGCGGCQVQSRSRRCLQPPCTGLSVEAKQCNLTPCKNCQPLTKVLRNCADNPNRLCFQEIGDKNCPCCAPLVHSNGQCTVPPTST